MPDVALLLRATRAKTLPLILAPVTVGAVLARERGMHVASGSGWVRAALALGGAAALHMAANVLNDVFDARTGADRMARIDRAGILTSPGLIDDGKLSVRAHVTLAAALLAVALACGAGLAARVSDAAAVWWLGAAGVFLALFYAAPPVRYGYRGRGLGEIAFVIAYGYLPVMGGFLAVAGRITPDARWAGLVPGLLTAVALSAHNLLHHRADKAAGKMTPAVVLEPEGALIVVGIAAVVAYTALVLQVANGLFPVTAAVALITAVPLAAAWQRAFADASPQRCLGLFGAALGAAVFTSGVLAVSVAAS